MGTYSHQSNNKTNSSISKIDNIGNTTNRLNDTKSVSEINSILKVQLANTSSESPSTTESRSRSPVFVPSLNTFDVNNGSHNSYHHLKDSGKGSSLLTGTSFDTLMNCLKSMREKDLDVLIHKNDDSLIRVTD